MDTGAPEGSPTPSVPGRDPWVQAPTPSPPPVPPVVPSHGVAELPPKERRRRVVSWALWDWGSAAFNAVATTFVFSVWLTSSAFVAPSIVSAADGAAEDSEPAKALADVIAQHSSWLGYGLSIAAVIVALLAPALGSQADSAGRRKLWLGVHSGFVTLALAAMFLVAPDPDRLTPYFLGGVALLAIGTVFFELAAVNYNALLGSVSTRDNVGKVSGFGWGMGYLGGIVLLFVLLVGFIGLGDADGMLGLTGDAGLKYRAAMLFSALWFGVFALPVLLKVPEPAGSRGERRRLGFLDSYRKLAHDIAELWRESRDTLKFLIASAVFRDGLTGVFTFGGIIAAGTFGFSGSDVIIFAIVANVVAGVATISSGWFDDRFGPKAVIVVSLIGLLIAGTAIFVLHAGGARVFWIFGLVLTIFVGPAQTASRTLLARVIPPGREAEVFGLYATTGRAAIFLAPSAFAVTIALGGAQYWGIVGIMLVLGLGLALLLPVRPERATWSS
jgi:UMF1 family MFS transporter